LNTITDTQREAEEILHNVTSDLRTRQITLEDWLQITRLALKDGYLSEMEKKRDDYRKMRAAAQSGIRGVQPQGLRTRTGGNGS